MTDVPDYFASQDEYDEWLEQRAIEEIDEYLDAYEAEDLHTDQVFQWADESPIFAGDDQRWARLYGDIETYAWVEVPETTIDLPREDPYLELARVAKQVVAEDLGCRMHELLEQRGYEVTA